MNRISKQFCKLYQHTVEFCVFVCAIWLMLSALLFTNFLSAKEVSSIQPDCTWLQILLLLLFCALSIFLKNTWARQQAPSSARYRLLRAISILCAGLTACFWVSQARLEPISDARYVQRAAMEIMGLTEMQSFYPGEYISCYPHQCGLVLFHCLLIKLFGAANLTSAFQYCNVLAYLWILFLLGRLCAAIGIGERGCFAATALGVLFFPLLLYVTFVYGTLLGLASAMTGLFCAIAFSRDGRWYYALGSGIFFFLSILFKSNYQIFVLGGILYAIFQGLRGQRRCWWLTAGLVLSFLLAGRIPVAILEARTGADLRHGFSPLSWFCMGLRDTGKIGPGWWDGYTSYTYFLCDMDPKLQNRYVIDELLEMLSIYLPHPRSMARFFLRKTATQWSEPLFAGLWLNQRMVATNGIPLPSWAQWLCSSQGEMLLCSYLNLLQTILYSGLVFWICLPAKREHRQEELLLAVILVGGFVFHLFWEAKSQYTLPYYVLSFPLAIQGYRNLASAYLHRRELPWSRRSRFQRFRCLLPAALLLLALLLSLRPMLLLYPNAT